MDRQYKRKAKFFSRTARPVKYYFIDFGISRRYDADNTSPREDPIWGGDKSVPEFQDSDDPQDPFPTDIYYLGNMIRTHLLQVRTLNMLLSRSPVLTDVLRAENTWS